MQTTDTQAEDASTPALFHHPDSAHYLVSGQANIIFQADPRLKGAVRLLGFVNHANMGDYRQQNQAFLRGATPSPEITAHPFTSSVKYGIGLNAEQQVSENSRVYVRFGWNEGQHESSAYTEGDQTFAIGGDSA